MTGYVRTDTTNNIADGNVISAADLDNEFNGVQAAFNSSTGHTHDGSSAEGAPITKLGPAQDVTISTTVLGVKTTNTVDLGTSSLKFKDFYLAGNASIGGTLGVTSTATFSGNTVLGDADTDTITQAASYVTGTQLKSAKTATNTLSLAAYDVDGTAYTNLITLTAGNTPTLALTSTGVGTINNMSIGATTASTGAFTTLSASGAVTLSGGTENGVAYLNGSKVLTTGSALVFDGNQFKVNVGTNLNFTVQASSTSVRLNYANDAGSANVDAAFRASNYIYQDGTGTESLRLTSTSLYTASTINVGIGLSNPATKMQISAAEPKLRITSTAGSGKSWDISSGGGTTVNAGQFCIYDTTTDAQRFNVVSGTGNMTLDSSGNLGVGVTSPVSRIDVRSPSSVIANYQQIQAFSTDTSAAIDLGGGIGLGGFHNSTQIATFGTIVGRKENGTSSNYAGYLAFGTNAQATGVVERMRIDSSGNLGLGVTPDASDWNASMRVFHAYQNTTNGAGVKLQSSNAKMIMSAGNAINYIGSIGATPIQFVMNSSAAMTLDASGNLLVGTTGLGTIGSSSGSTITASGAIYSASTGESIFSRRSSDGDVILFRRDTTGVGSIAVTTVLTTYNTTSDYRLKNITGALTGAKDFIMALQPKQGTWKADGSKFVGFLAHEFQEVSPSSVSGVKDAVDEDGKPIMQSMQASSSEVIANMVSLLQEQQALITQLTARITALEGA